LFQVNDQVFHNEENTPNMPSLVEAESLKETVN